MRAIWSKQALTPKGWADDVLVEFGDDGRITAVTDAAPPKGEMVDVLVSAPTNSHSHAFQRAMAGLTEKRGRDASDSFWTWRRLMFRFLERISPDDVEAIAAMVQMEMLEAGFATNVEFHYLHHQPGGAPYSNLAEMSYRILAAAVRSGIGLTLLPVQYQFGGCDGRALGAGQVRFGNDPDRYARLIDDVADSMKAMPDDTMLGVAPHSLRAVGQTNLRRAPQILGTGPVHLHLAEQKAEVEEVRDSWGARPVEWALDNLPLDDRWCLIHCTQMQPHETVSLARTGAVAGLCPLTEASLGDGIFDGVRWMGAGGRISVGSDSNIRISLAEELRSLETSQRLRDHTRAALATQENSTGRRLFDAVCHGGAQAGGRGNGRIAIGEWADLLALDMNHVDLAGLRGDTILDSFAFSGDTSMVAHVWSAGRHMVSEGVHRQREEIVAAYRKAVVTLRTEL